VEDVVVLGRRGPAESAFTVPEFVGLLGADVDIVVEGALPGIVPGMSFETEQKLRLLHEVANRPVGERKRIVFRYQAAPARVLGTDHVTGVEVVRTVPGVDAEGRVTANPTGETERIDAGLVLTSVGYRGVPTPGLPFDERAGVVPNREGRVLDGEAARPGTYVTGWIKRGPTGFIGTNKSCAQQTVQRLAEDFNAGLLPDP